jgi:hypothetical protein
METEGNHKKKNLLQNRLQIAQWNNLKMLPYLVFGYVARSEAIEENSSPIKGEIMWSIHNVSMKEFIFQIALQSPSGENGSFFVELFQTAWDRENFYALTEEAVENALDPYEDGEDQELTNMANILKQELNNDEYSCFSEELFTFIISLAAAFNEHPEDKLENLFRRQERDIHLLQRIFNFY